MNSPKHKSTGKFLDGRLFDGVTSFTELETKIEALPTEQQRGATFEVFAEAYLATQKLHHALEVWPDGHIPQRIQRELKLPTKDMGVDGVYVNSLGEHHAYQVKFRSKRASLTWRELSTFMGLAEYAQERVLITNSEHLPKVMNDRSEFFCIRGSDLDRMEERDFDAIREWFTGSAPTFKKKEPRPHQRKALRAFQTSLELNDRSTFVMACGTGKSLVALWAAEQSNVKSVLVLVPSLALVRQILHEWSSENSWASSAFLVVCSDESVSKGQDATQLCQFDLDFHVTTDAVKVREWFNAPFDGTRVIFSTYPCGQKTPTC